MYKFRREFKIQILILNRCQLYYLTTRGYQSQSNRTPPSITQKWERPMHKHKLTEMPQGDRKRIQPERVRMGVRACMSV